MPLNPDNGESSSSSPMLLIDFRSGSVEMLLGLDRWHADLPISRADCSQINTAQGIVILQPGPQPNSAFAPLLDQGD